MVNGLLAVQPHRRAVHRWPDAELPTRLQHCENTTLVPVGVSLALVLQQRGSKLELGAQDQAANLPVAMNVIDDRVNVLVVTHLHREAHVEVRIAPLDPKFPDLRGRLSSVLELVSRRWFVSRTTHASQYPTA
ncbi:hypothetical protein [Asanoa hainanensis]|uniref:hypothetical protein n=1 Tax=Asanoa hainanensis TaxID=560556 RepID=UPI00117C4798|nr:hypothetical protein [Asanoa hainanensis]